MGSWSDGHTQSYTSVVAKWDSKSAVRTKPRRLLAPEDEGLTFFSAELTPAVSHPLVRSQGDRVAAEILTRRLYSYLDFTAILEQDIVNPVVLELSRDAYGFTLPGSMRFDAHRIYCDEAYHALFSADIKSQVEMCTGIVAGTTIRPDFSRAIRSAKYRTPANLHGLVELCATVVSETLISGTLTTIPADTSVVRAVRESLADHAADERTHHAYFTKVLEVVWPQIDWATRRLLGPQFAEFILAFLAPDMAAHSAIVTASGFRVEEARQILTESHPATKTLLDIRQDARCTIRLLDRAGVLEDPKTADYFVEVGLLSG